MLRNKSVLKTENIKSHLFACTGKVVYGLHKNFIAVLKCANRVYGGLYGRASEICNRTAERFRAGSICKIMLNVIVFQ